MSSPNPPPNAEPARTVGGKRITGGNTRNDSQEEFARSPNAPPLPGILDFAGPSTVAETDTSSKKIAVVDTSPKLRPQEMGNTKATPSTYNPPPKPVETHYPNPNRNLVHHGQINQPRGQTH